MSHRRTAEVQVDEDDNQGVVKPQAPAGMPANTNFNPKGVLPLLSALTLVGNRMGGGVVGVPFAIKTIGYTTAALYMTLHVCICIFSIYLLLRVKDIIGRSSLSDIGIYCYGKYSIYVINAVIALAQLGYPIIFFIVFGDVSGALIERAHGGSSFWSSRWFTHVILASVMVYLILKKDISQLKYAGIFLFVAVSCFLLLFLVHYFVEAPKPEKEVDFVESEVNLGFFAAFPTLISAFSFNPAFFTAYSSLKVKSNKNGIFIGSFAIIGVYVIYLFAPIIAFKMYGSDVKSNLLLNISAETAVLPTILQFIFMIIAVVHIPLIFFVGKEAVLIIFDEATRSSYSNPTVKNPEVTVGLPEAPAEDHQSAPVVEHVIDPLHHSEEDDENSPGAEVPSIAEPSVPNPSDSIQNASDLEGGSHSPANISRNDQDESLEQSGEKVEKIAPNPKAYLEMKPVYYYLITISCYMCVVLLSIVVGDVKIFFGLMGATTGSWALFLGPGSFYVISVHKKKLGFPTKTSVVIYVFAWIYLVIGVIGVIGLNKVVLFNAFG